MDTPNTGQSVRLLSTQGNGTFYETNYNLEPLDKLEIRVRAVMTGVCRSDCFLYFRKVCMDMKD